MNKRRRSWIDSIGWVLLWGIYAVVASAAMYLLFRYLKGIFIYFFGRKNKQAG